MKSWKSLFKTQNNLAMDVMDLSLEDYGSTLKNGDPLRDTFRSPRCQLAPRVVV